MRRVFPKHRAQAEKAGAKITRPPEKTFSGGYAGHQPGDCPPWPGRRLRKIGLVLIFFSGIGAVVSGLAPQDLMPIAHMIAAGLAIASINIGLILLGFAALKKQPAIGLFALLCGGVGMVGWIMLGTPPYAGLGYGGWQRVAGFPSVIWGICMGAYWLFTSKDSQWRFGPKYAR